MGENLARYMPKKTPGKPGVFVKMLLLLALKQCQDRLLGLVGLG